VFEAHASRQVGMPVRVHGSVGARLLPSPSLTLRDLEAGPEGREAPFKAAEVAVEFALGSLLRGEWRATEARIVRPQLSAGLDETGRLDWSGYALQPDADVQSIERLSIEGGEVHLADRASGGRLRLEKLWFKGEVKSLLAGPLKGEGGFALDGEGYGFRIALGRLAEDGARVKLSLDTLTRPFSIEADGLARLEQQVPIFEGSLTAIRPAHVTLKGGRPVASEPWRVATRVKARAAGVLFEQIDAQYGPDDRALRIGGAAELKLRGGVRLEGVFSARQIDIDRLVGLPEAQRRLPILALRRFAESFADGLKWPVSLRLGIGIDVLTLGGAAVQQVRGDIAAEDSTWNIENLEFRAPGLTQVRTSGRLSLSSQGAAFAGPLVIEANHLSALVGWLEGRDAPASQGGTFRAAGEVTLGTHGFAIERLKAEIDRRTLEGRVLYTWAAPPRPARLDAELRAADLDIDQALAFARAALAGTKLDMPGETMLNLDLGRARIAGIEAKGVRARLREDADGVSIERLAIADLGGTALDARGRIESLSALPQGSIHVDIDGPRIDGILDMLGRFAPAATAEMLRPLGPRLAPAKLRASLRLAAAGASSAANLALAGRLGPLRVDLSADALGELSAPAAAVVGLSGRLEAEDGRALVSILGLDPIVAAEQAPGSLELTVSGPLTGDLKVDGRLVAGGLDATWRGTGRWSDAEAVNAAFDVSVWARNASLPSQTSPQPRFPIVVKARVLWKDRTVRLDEMTGTVAGTGVRGRLAITRGRSIEVNGNLQLDALDVGPALAAVAGAPLPTQNPARWQVQPFGRGLLADLSGEIELGVTRAVFTPSLVARQVRSVLRLSGAEVAIEDIDATLAGGRLTGRLELRGAVDALAAKGRLTLAGAEISALSGQAASFLSGRVGLELEAEGRGPGSASLIGSLRGKGTISLEGVRVAGLAARPFEAPIAAVEQGAPLDPGKVTAMVEAALAAGRLTLPRVETPLTLSAGLLRWGQITAVIDGTELSATGGIDLAEWAIDARLTLSGPAARGDAGRPEIFVLFRGPLESPRRTLDASAFAGWLMLRAVDVQAKRVEELEAARRREAEGARMGSPPAASPLTDRRSDAGPPAAVPSGEPNAASARTAASPTSHPRRPRRGANGSSQEHPLKGPPPLPPPLEIRPLPGPRSGRGSTSGQATQELLVGPNR
jgi:large subunit ribosomal protein L24